MAADVYNEAGQSVINEVGELVVKKPWVGMTCGFWKILSVMKIRISNDLMGMDTWGLGGAIRGWHVSYHWQIR